MTLTIATYFWSDPASRHKFAYTADDVRLLKSMVRRHLTVKHDFAVITDTPHAFDGDRDIRAILMNKGTHVPGTCFARLFTFHPMGEFFIGERVLQIDLDSVPVGNMDHLVERGEDLVLWRNPGRVPWDNPSKPGRPFYNTSFLLHRCGTMPRLHQEFNPKNPGCRDDQWWLSDQLGPQMPYWDASHGLYRLGRDDTPGSGVNGVLPENAACVTFPGSGGKPSDEVRRDNAWIDQHLPRGVAAWA